MKFEPCFPIDLHTYIDVDLAADHVNLVFLKNKMYPTRSLSVTLGLNRAIGFYVNQIQCLK